MEILISVVIYFVITCLFNDYNRTKIPETFIEGLKSFCLPYVIIKREKVRKKL